MSSIHINIACTDSIHVMFEDQAIDESCIADMDLFGLNRLGIRMGHAATLKRVLRVRSLF
jgi:hypothetical protein